MQFLFITKNEAVAAKNKANAYKAELDNHLRLKQERVAREKASKKAEERQERLMLDQQFAALNQITGGGRKRIQPGGAPLPKQSMLPTQAPGNMTPLNQPQRGVGVSQESPGMLGGPMRPMGMGDPRSAAMGQLGGYPVGFPPRQTEGLRQNMYDGTSQVQPRSRPVGGSDSMARALSPTAMGMPAHMMIDQQSRDGILPSTNGGPAIHRKYRSGLKDPAEMEQLMIKRQREARQAAILEQQLREQKERRAKEKAQDKKIEEEEEKRIKREREDILRNDKDREAANAKFQAEKKDLVRQIEEKKRLKALKVAEEKEYQRKLQEKCDRDNEELQRQYDEERGIKTSPKKKSRKERKAEMENPR
jgi:hypothetical protein